MTQENNKKSSVLTSRLRLALAVVTSSFLLPRKRMVQQPTTSKRKSEHRIIHRIRGRRKKKKKSLRAKMEYRGGSVPDGVRSLGTVCLSSEKPYQIYLKKQSRQHDTGLTPKYGLGNEHGSRSEGSVEHMFFRGQAFGGDRHVDKARPCSRDPADRQEPNIQTCMTPRLLRS